MDKKDLENLRLPPLEEILGEALGDFIEEEVEEEMFTNPRYAEYADATGVYRNVCDEAFSYDRSASSKYRKGDFRGALRDYDKAVSLIPGEYSFHVGRVAMFGKMDKISEAKKALKWAEGLNFQLVEDYVSTLSDDIDGLEEGLTCLEKSVNMTIKAEKLFGDRKYYDRKGKFRY